MLRCTYLLLLASLAGCSAGAANVPECHRGSDCASGVCNADGTCGPSGGAAGSGGTGGATAAGGSSGSGGDQTSTGGTSAQAGTGGTATATCSPNGDGQITRDETPLAAGLSARFRDAQGATVDTAGKPDGSGGKTWDMTAMLPGDHDTIIETQPLAGQWFASQFPGATYAARLSDTNTLLGVFEVNQTALLLRGIVSPTMDTGYTAVSYSPPVTILQFPLSVGASWSTQSTVSGVVMGVPATYLETYQTKVDQSGTAIVPFGTFPVLRVGTVLTQTVGALVTVKRTYSFAAECFGIIAKIQSKDDEPNAEFTTASEITRLAP